MKESFIVSHPTGNTFVGAILKELFKRDQLKVFFTTIGFGQDSSFKNLGRRTYSIPDKLIDRQILKELLRISGLVKGNHIKTIATVDKIYKMIDRKVSVKLEKEMPDVIHSYEDCSYQTFIRAKELGIKCSYELPIAYWSTNRKLMSEEAERYPHWASTLETLEEPEEKLVRKEEELMLADYVTCPSEFVLKSIPYEIRKKTPCQIAYFGSPNLKPIPTWVKEKKKGFKLLFVGSMSQRKGLADLFEAMKHLSNIHVTLSILGQPSMPMEFYRKQFAEFKYFPPCSNEKVREIMTNHDILILPSIAEGRALVQQEALSCGLPIIVTPNAGGEDLVTEGKTGHIVPIRSPLKIAEKIVELIEDDITKEDRVEICQRKSAEYSWKNYSQKIISISK